MTSITAKKERPSNTPEFIRMPKPGTVCPHTGLTRAFLYYLAGEGLIKTVSLRQRGKTRGVRLIVYDSLMTYIRKAAKQAEAE